MQDIIYRCKANECPVHVVVSVCAHLLHVINPSQQLGGYRVEFQQVHSIQRALQQVNDSCQLNRPSPREENTLIRKWESSLPEVQTYIIRRNHCPQQPQIFCVCVCVSTLMSSLLASCSFLNLYSPSQGLTAEGGAMHTHFLQSVPLVIVSTE